MVAFNKNQSRHRRSSPSIAISEDDISTRELGDDRSVSPRWTRSNIHLKSSQTIEWIVPVQFHDRKKYDFAGAYSRKENAHMGKQATSNKSNKNEDIQHVACRTMA
ncbi:UNVERIFIED_CONTAM: hypothetical protein Sradi_3975800 [Sesamum radiatum]|uniref:Uncharacterized protein n=1 Tax=Sesamum radiatum TaxID=300843 RepID=A0AAW2PHU5_SESRA